MSKIRLCKEKDCDNTQTTAGFCRLHYLQNWRKIRLEKRKRAAKNLNQYVEHVMKRFPKRYIDEIKKDIHSDDFEERVGGSFGPQEEDVPLFDPPSRDEEVEEILSRIKIEKEF